MKIVQIKEKQVKNFFIYNIKKKYIVREKSRAILKLLEDRDKLMEERKNYSQWRSRIEGVGSNGVVSSEGYGSYSGTYGATSSDNYYSSSYNDYNYNNDSKKKKKKKKESDSESSSEEDDEEENEKKKKKKEKKIQKKRRIK